MQPDQLLFRQEAVDAQKAASLGTIRLATPVSHQVWTLAAISFAAAIFAWLLLGHYTRREHVTGSLVPKAGLLTVTSRNAGTVTGLRVTEGSEVRAGEALLTISDERSSAALGDTSAAISIQMREQQAVLRSDLDNTQRLADVQAEDLHMQQKMVQDQIQQVNGQLDIERRQVIQLTDMLHRFEKLSTTGYASALDIQQQRSQELNAESQVKSLTKQRSESEEQLKSIGDQLTQLPLTTTAKLNDLHRQMNQVEQSLVQNEADRAIVLRAPEDGMVSSVLVAPGQAVVPGQPLLAVMPKGSQLQAQLFVSSSAIGFVHMGTPVVMHYQAFPYEKFGAQRGTVVGISHNSLTPNEITLLLGEQPPPEALYRVQVRLANQNIEAYGKLESLKPGMILDADLLLDRRRMIEWIFEPLYGMGHRLVGRD